jgi:hypothetical protein
LSETIPYGEWRPDVSDYRGQHSQTIYNVLPRGDGYGPVKDISPFTSALPSACRGLFIAFNTDGTPFVYAGTATKLYKLNNSNLTWGDVSKTSGSNISLTGLTSIGNLTGGGGLAASFDGTTAQAIAACSSLTTTTFGYVGKTMGSGTAIRSATVFGSNDQGYISGSNPTTTIDLYGKQGTAPASSTDGTIIGTTTFADTADESAGRTITSTDGTTLWDHVWVRVSTASSSTIDVAELRLTGTASYSLATNDLWRFAQLGSVVMATEQNDPVQAFTMGSSTQFADLAGSPPQASYIAVVNEFVLLSGLLSTPYRVAWSARADTTGWTAGTNGSDIQDLPDGGVVRAIVGGETDAIVFQDNSIRRMTYVGGDLIFEFVRIASDKGLRAAYSPVTVAGRTFFLSYSGFEVIVQGGYPTPIGKEKFDRTFLAEWDDSRKGLMQGAADPDSTRIFWFYKSNSSSSTALFDKCIVWDWMLERATRIKDITGECAGQIAQPGTNLDTPVTSNIDTFGLSLDDVTGSVALDLAIANSSHQVGFMTGTILEAIMDTSEVVGDARTFVSKHRPVTDAGTVYGSVMYRNKGSDAVSQSTEVVMRSDGFIPNRADARNIRIRTRIPSGTSWTYAIGVEPTMVSTGQR